jgi:hypothetical protein
MLLAVLMRRTLDALLADAMCPARDLSPRGCTFSGVRELRLQIRGRMKEDMDEARSEELCVDHLSDLWGKLLEEGGLGLVTDRGENYGRHGG